MRKFLRILGLVVGVPLLAGLIYQPVATAVDARRYPPPGRLVAVNGHRLHIQCEGSGRPTVVLEAGPGGSSLDWSLVLPGVARQTRTCVYDRAGHGWSEPGPLPRTGTAVADELHTLLIRAEEPGPYVIAAHSLGGLYARIFAGRYPAETAGLVLINPVADAAGGTPVPTARFHAALSHMSFHRVLSAAHILPEDLGGLEAKLPVDARAPYRAVTSSSRHFAALRAESEGMAVAAEQAGAARLPKTTPLVVVAPADRTGELEPLLGQAGRSLLVLVHETGPYVHLDRPTVVLDAITDLVDTIRWPR